MRTEGGGRAGMGCGEMRWCEFRDNQNLLQQLDSFV